MSKKQRCQWCVGNELYEAYHDEEWGVPVSTDQELFERLILEGMQAGLSWLTVLMKRERMRKQFFGFHIQRLATRGERRLDNWLQDAGLIRHRGKLEAMISNARLAAEDDEFSDWLWSFAPSKIPVYKRLGDVPNTTPDSVAMSKALKRRGYRFVGPTTCYAFMQSVGMVNDHVADCFRHKACQKLQRQ